MGEAELSPKIECTLQRVESYIQKVRETGDLSWLTAIVGAIVRVQADTSPSDDSSCEYW